MRTPEEISEFNRSKIYEVLDYQPEPAGYKSNIPWIVQQQIAATNGRHYIDRIGKLDDYPAYELPVPNATGQKLMLDIGCGWGRWLVAGDNKGYIPVGIDIRLEFCKTSRKVMADFRKHGYAIVADLENIPFKENTFDLVWSFSVIQHTHLLRLKNSLAHIQRILRPDGFSYLEFPNKHGIRNRFGPAKNSTDGSDDYNSWDVRYYSPKEYRVIFEEFLTEFEFFNHSFLGIGVLSEDLKYVSLKNGILCAVSLTGSFFARTIPGLKNYSDSIYVKSSKKAGNNGSTNDSSLMEFLRLHKVSPADNLNVVPLLRCPITGQSLRLSDDRNKLINEKGGFYFPVVDAIPILISAERQGL